MRKVISFALYGDDYKYINGAFENIRLRDIYYPGWTCRFYLGIDIDYTIHDQLLKKNNVEVVETLVSGWQCKFTRLEIMFDEEIDIFIIRDLDSRFSHREVQATNEWIKSDKVFHIMRDHKRHTALIMGCAYGGKKGFLNKNYLECSYEAWIYQLSNGMHKGEKYCKKHGKSDQGYLAHNIWPLIKDKALIHDDRNLTGNDLRFTLPNKRGRFIGQQFNERNEAILV